MLLYCVTACVCVFVCLCVCVFLCLCVCVFVSASVFVSNVTVGINKNIQRYSPLYLWTLMLIPAVSFDDFCSRNHRKKCDISAQFTKRGKRPAVSLDINVQRYRGLFILVKCDLSAIPECVTSVPSW